MPISAWPLHLVRLGALVLPALLWGAALASDEPEREGVAVPSDALGWESQELDWERGRIARMEERLGPWGQVDVSARIDSVLRLRDYVGDGQGPEQSGRLSLSARIDFADPPATHARSLQTLQRARNGLHVQKVRGVRDALLAHAYLLIAQEEVRRAERGLAEAQEDTAAHASGGLDRRQGELDLEEARLDLREAREELRAAREDADAFELPPAAVYERTRFRLPDIEALAAGYEQAHDYRMLRLELLEAQAELQQTKRAPLDDLRLKGGYRTRAGNVDLEGGLVNGGPALTLGMGSAGGPERWELEVSAQLVLDGSHTRLPLLEEEVERAAAALEAYPARHRRELESVYAQALLAEEALTLAEEEASLLEARLRAAVAELAAAGIPSSDGAEEEQRFRAVSTAQGRLSAGRIRLYRAWIAYVRATASLLEGFGGGWELRSGRPAPNAPVGSGHPR